MSDTRDIISQSIASMREDGPGDGGPDVSTDTPDVDTSTESVEPTDTGDSTGDHPEESDTPAVPEPVSETPEAPAVPEPPKDNEDFDTEPEFTTDKNGRKMVNRIPQPRVKKMVERAVARVTEAKEKEFTERVSTYETRIRDYEGLGEIMATDPDRFFSMLQNAYPAYKQFGKQGAQPAAPAEQARDNDPMPQPDARLADGTPAYSPEGFQKVQEWQARQVEQRVLGKVNERYGWVDEERQARERQEAAVPVVRAQIQDATQNWDGFKEHADEILAELRADTQQRLSLHDAYRVVMNRKIKAEREAWAKEREQLVTTRNKTREEVLREIQGRPAATATVPATAAARPDPAAGAEPRDTRDIIRERIAGLRRTA